MVDNQRADNSVARATHTENSAPHMQWHVRLSSNETDDVQVNNIQLTVLYFVLSELDL